MIVGGLLASGLALGMGTASAATPTCTDSAGTTRDISGALDKVVRTSSGECAAKDDSLLSGLTDLLSSLPVYVAPTTSTSPKPPPTTTAKPIVTTTTKAPDPDSQSVGAGGGGQNLPAASGPIGGAPAPFVAPPAGAAAGPLGAFSPAAFGGIAPAGLASNLFGANAYDPGLLFGSPLGGAAAQLFNPQAGSGVTTVSQAQVLSGPGRGYGTPATIGVIILACLIGFAVRHRVITRMKARDLPEDTTPRHAAPEVEQVDDESDARTTVLTH